jgi:hypothetical protein
MKRINRKKQREKVIRLPDSQLRMLKSMLVWYCWRAILDYYRLHFMWSDCSYAGCLQGYYISEYQTIRITFCLGNNLASVKIIQLSTNLQVSPISSPTALSLKHTGMVLLDTENAYDTFWTTGLLYKLILLRLPACLLFFLKSSSASIPEVLPSPICTTPFPRFQPPV